MPSTIPGPIGSGQAKPRDGHDSPVQPGSRMASPVPAGVKFQEFLPLENKPLQTGQKEITLVGAYANPWSNAEEVAILKAGSAPQATKHWSPHTDDFAALAKLAGIKGVVEIATIRDLLSTILAEPEGSILRLNLITHSNSTTLGLSGRIVKDSGDVYFDGKLSESFIGEKIQEEISIDDDFRTTWSDIRKRFAKDATLYLYACNAGASANFRTKLRKAFGVTVHGSEFEMRYCAYEGNGAIDRGKHRVFLNSSNETDPVKLAGMCSTVAVADLKKLTF